MKMAPKFSEADARIPECFRSYMQGYCEVQLLNSNLGLAYNKASRVIHTLSREFGVQTFIVHMPHERSLIENTLFSEQMYLETEALIEKLAALSKGLNVEICLLFHSNTSSTYVAHEYLIAHIRKVLECIKRYNLKLIIENEITSLNDYSTTPIVEIAREIEDNSLGFCFDLCHWQASENVLMTKLSLPAHIRHRIAVVHFSATVDNDGFRDKPRTHGRMHTSVDSLIDDLGYLQELGIDTQRVILVTEVCETDYKERPDMLRELEMLYSINALKGN